MFGSQPEEFYPLDEVLLLCLVAVLARAETFVDMARFRDRKQAFLRRLRPLLEGARSHDHLGDFDATLNAKQFQRSFGAWVSSLTGMPGGMIAIDGKTLRRSYQKLEGKTAIHMFSAFTVRLQSPHCSCRPINWGPWCEALGHRNSFHWVLDMDFRDDEFRV